MNKKPFKKLKVSKDDASLVAMFAVFSCFVGAILFYEIKSGIQMEKDKKLNNPELNAAIDKVKKTVGKYEHIDAVDEYNKIRREVSGNRKKRSR